MVAISLSISNSYALRSVNNPSFSINIPDNWVYVSIGRDIVQLTPTKFAILFLNHETINQKLEHEGAYSSFDYDWLYGIRNAAFDVYVKYKIDHQDGMKVTSEQNVTIDNETAVKIYGDGINSFNSIKFVQYLVWHDKKPYFIGYKANAQDYQKYLPEFEQTVKSLKFVIE